MAGWWNEEESPAYAAFCRDIPEAMQEDVLIALSEAVGGYPPAPHIHVFERDTYDAINARGHGTIEVGGVEYAWQLESGNHNGTVLLAWESDKPFEPYHRTEWALQPVSHLVGDAIAAGRGPFLILKWDAILKNRPEVASIPGSYTYDRMMQPGGKVEKHWKAKAAEHHFEIVSRETADETRKRLSEAKGGQP